MGAHEYLRFFLAFIFVMSLMGLLGYAMRRWGRGGMIMNNSKRLSVVEIRPIDARHRLAIVKCDDTEHLLVLSPDGQTIIQSNLGDLKK